MLRYIARRLGFMVLTMLLVSMVIFLVSEAAPGDVARKKIRRELDSSESEPCRLGKALCQQRFSESREVFEQNVTAGEKCGDYHVNCRSLTDDRALYGAPDPGRKLLYS